jgi:membrane dipeptidase
MDPIPVFDGHNDTLLNLLLRKRGGGRDFFERSAVGHVDLPRALEGGFGGGFFACFAPPNPRSGWTEEAALTVTSEGYEVAGAPPLDPEYARGFADAMAKLLFRLEGEAEGRLRVVRTAAEIEGCIDDGALAAILHFEGARTSARNRGRSKSCTTRACARSGSCGAGPTPTRTASRSGFRRRRTRARG